VLVSALTFDLMREAFDTGGAGYTIGGFLLGAVIYVVADVGLERMAAKSRSASGATPPMWFPDAAEKQESPQVAAVAGTALLVGAVLDGAPKSIAIGVSVHAEGPSLWLVLLGRSSRQSAGRPRQCGRTAPRGPYAWIHRGVWTAVAVVCTTSTVAGYALLSGLSPGLTSAILPLAAEPAYRDPVPRHRARWFLVSVLVSFASVRQQSPLSTLCPDEQGRTHSDDAGPCTVALKSGRSAVRPRPCPPTSLTSEFAEPGELCLV